MVLQPEFPEGVLGIPPDGHDAAGLEGVQQGEEQVLAGPALGPGVAAVRQGLAGFEWMQREDVPEKNGSIHPGEHLPDYGCGSLRDGRALGGASQGEVAVGLGEGGEVRFVGQRQAGAAPAAVAEIPGDPEGIDARAQRRVKQSAQVGAAPEVRIGPVAVAASFAVRVEDPVEANLAQGLDEGARGHGRIKTFENPAPIYNPLVASA